MDSCYNVCDSFYVTKCNTIYYNLRQVLQSALIITNCTTVQISHYL